MTDARDPAPALDVARGRAVDVLSAHFAHDGMTVEELDRRLDRVYAARSVPELETLVQDIPQGSRALARHSAAVATWDDHDEEFHPEAAAESERILAIMSETRRNGLWVVPRRLEVASIMSETVLDMRQASLHAGVTDIDITGIMTKVTIIVPPGVRVSNRVFAFMGAARDRTVRDPDAGAGAPLIRVNGWAVMAEVLIRRG